MIQFDASAVSVKKYTIKLIEWIQRGDLVSKEKNRFKATKKNGFNNRGDC